MISAVAALDRVEVDILDATADVRASCDDCSQIREAVPPMWNVRIVSCVPGSPIDWAAMTPTASPMSTICAGRQIAPVALDADAAPRFAGQHRADAHALDAARVLNLGRHVFGDLIARPRQDLSGDRVANIFEGDAADDAFAQPFDDVAAFGDRLGPDALDRAAIAVRR